MNSVERNEKELETIEKKMETIKEEKAPSDENQKKPAFAVKGNSAMKTTIAVGLAAAIIGGVIGYSVKPVAKTQDLVVTEDVSAVGQCPPCCGGALLCLRRLDRGLRGRLCHHAQGL